MDDAGPFVVPNGRYIQVCAYDDGEPPIIHQVLAISASPEAAKRTGPGKTPPVWFMVYEPTFGRLEVSQQETLSDVHRSRLFFCDWPPSEDGSRVAPWVASAIAELRKAEDESNDELEENS